MSAAVLQFATAAKRAVDVAGVEFEIKALFMLGLTGAENVFVPFVSRGHYGTQDIERSQPLRDAVIDGLDRDRTYPILARLLAESACPIARELRISLGDGYVADHAAEIAELRSTSHE